MAITSRLTRLETMMGGTEPPAPAMIDLGELMRAADRVHDWLDDRGYPSVGDALAAGEKPPVEEEYIRLMLGAEADLEAARHLGDWP